MYVSCPTFSPIIPPCLPLASYYRPTNRRFATAVVFIDKATKEIRQEEEGVVYHSIDELVEELPDHSPRFVLLSHPVHLVRCFLAPYHLTYFLVVSILTYLPSHLPPYLQLPTAQTSTLTLHLLTSLATLPPYTPFPPHQIAQRHYKTRN